MDIPPDETSDHAGVMVPPPMIYAAFFLAGMGLQRYVPLARLPPGVVRIPGVVFVSLWLVLTVWSFWLFWSAGTKVVPIRPSTALVVAGPYRFTRNPMYLGLLFLYIGVACWFGHPWPLVLAPLLVWVITVPVIGREERYLTRAFGDAYRQYQARVRRWL